MHVIFLKTIFRYKKYHLSFNYKFSNIIKKIKVYCWNIFMYILEKCEIIKEKTKLEQRQLNT